MCKAQVYPLLLWELAMPLSLSVLLLLLILLFCDKGMVSVAVTILGDRSRMPWCQLNSRRKLDRKREQNDASSPEGANKRSHKSVVYQSYQATLPGNSVKSRPPQCPAHS